jgi:hypothetical protein
LSEFNVSLSALNHLLRLVKTLFIQFESSQFLHVKY